MALVVNFIAGPGSGKSTLTAETFSLLKWAGVNCEIASEYAKDKVWEDSLRILEDQPYMLGKQHHRQFILNDKVDVILTDCPLVMFPIYGAHWGKEYVDYALYLFNRFENLNFFVGRTKPYNPSGRVQDEKKAKIIDAQLGDFLSEKDIPFKFVLGMPGSAHLVKEEILRRLENG